MATTTPEPATVGQPAPRRPARASSMSRGMRETIESIAIALALAFLFKTFEAEAFIIPTGSMAPTLMGRHKDVECPQCGFHYTASGSDEADRFGNELADPGSKVVACTCPICRFTMSTEPTADGFEPNPSYSGDRIWVSKVPYHFTEPRRFEVIVFRFPEEAETYFIKRLVGLPNETVRIRHGDLYVKRSGEEKFSIVRKPPERLLAMAQVVHDNDYVSEELVERGWPVRWQEWNLHDEDYWKLSSDTRTYQTDGKAPGDSWIRYEHTVPSEDNWLRGLWPPRYEPRPQLITDFYAFNTRILRKDRGPDPYSLGLHWVGDLLLECEVDVKGDQGSVLLDLVKGGRHFGCQIDVATGQARLSIQGLPDWKPTASTAVRGPGVHKLLFANADRELRLWVDGQLVEFDVPTTYQDLGNERPQSDESDPGDLAPLGIGSRGVAMEVRHLRVMRDIYYIADRWIRMGDPISDYPNDYFLLGKSRAQMAGFLASPSQWVDALGRSVFDDRQSEEFQLGPDQFFVLGDNSPASSDARLWNQNYVDRKLLVGKALMIYWPHPLRLFVPGTDVSLGVIPNVPEMGLIR